MSNSSAINFNYLFKYIIIGDAAVGKSNILLRYAHGQFKDEYQLTIGVEFGAKNIEIKNKIYRIQIWDTAGQENFRSITRAYYKNSVCAIIAYDITKRTSFENVQEWIEEVRSQSPKQILLVLVGNKIDLEKERVVAIEEGKKLAQENDMIFLETSALTGEGVDDVFNKSCQDIYQNIQKNYYDLSDEACGIKEGEKISDNIDLSADYEEMKKKKKCCNKN